MIEFRGAEVARSIREDSLKYLEILEEKNIIPNLAIVRVGEDFGAISYEKSALKKAEEMGIKTSLYTLDICCTEDDLIETIEKINGDDNIHGILLLKPLPKEFNSDKILNRISPLKDIDCNTYISYGKFFTGDCEAFAPCTAQSVMEFIKYYNIETRGKNALVIGRSLVIGKPVAKLLTDADANVTICHSKTSEEQLIDFGKKADIVVCATGVPRFFNKKFMTDRQAIFDVGVSMVDGKMVGDVDFEEAKNLVYGCTPVPRGIGSVTTTILMKNLLQSAVRAMDLTK